jgi:hypothetical protein
MKGHPSMLIGACELLPCFQLRPALTASKTSHVNSQPSLPSKKFQLLSPNESRRARKWSFSSALVEKLMKFLGQRLHQDDCGLCASIVGKVSSPDIVEFPQDDGTALSHHGQPTLTRDMVTALVKEFVALSAERGGFADGRW